MDTFLRPPMSVYRRMHRIYICSRYFNTRSARQSVGMGMSQQGQDYDSKLNQFYQDNKMQKLWNNTFERISAFQNNQLNQNYPSKGATQNPMSTDFASIGGFSPSERSGTGSFSGMGAGSGGDNSNDPDIKMRNSMFSLDNQQLMKLSFAEGYFYGQENRKKKSKSGAWTIFRGVLVMGLATGIAYSLVAGDSVFKQAFIRKKFQIQPEDINVTFDDVKGCDESKQELSDIVEFLKHPHKFSRLGGKLPRGVLLVGPPGTGKTLMARAVAGEAGVPFFHASGSEFDEILVGQGARRVRDLFEKAKQKTPCVIFIDEIDSVGGKRTNSVLHPYANQTINQLLSEMDGFSQSEGVIVIGATNRARDLDKALLRPGRFDVQVTVPVPDYKGRKELFDHYLSKVRSTNEIDIDVLCRTTIGFTGADIENLVNQAALKAATDDLDLVNQITLEYARDKVLMGPERRNKLPDKETNLMTAFHEGGHALVAYYTEKANSLHKVTIISRGSSLGHTSTLPDRDVYSQTKEQLMAMMDVTLGGRVAEELVYGSDRVTTGCGDDLKKANMLATHMVKDYGMSEKVGMRVVREDDTTENSQLVVNGFSDATSELVESEISRLLEESKERVRQLLTKRTNELKLLAEALVKYETLDAAEVKLVIEGKDPKLHRQLRDSERRIKLKGSNVKPGGNPHEHGDRLPLNLFK